MICREYSINVFFKISFLLNNMKNNYTLHKIE